MLTRAELLRRMFGGAIVAVGGWHRSSSDDQRSDSDSARSTGYVGEAYIIDSAGVSRLHGKLRWRSDTEVEAHWENVSEPMQIGSGFARFFGGPSWSFTTNSVCTNGGDIVLRLDVPEHLRQW